MEVSQRVINKMLWDLKKNPARLLTIYEERTLHAGYTLGLKSNDCHWALVSHNAGLARAVCKDYRYAAYYEDMVQFAITGIYHAVIKWDPSRNLKFSTYAVWWARQRVFRYRYNSVSMIRVPEHALFKCIKIKSLTLEYIKAHGEDPPAEWLATELSCTVDAMETARASGLIEPVSLEGTYGYHGGVLSDWAGIGTHPSAEVVHFSSHPDETVLQALSTLTPINAEILILFFGINCEKETQTQIGIRYGLSKQAVDQRITIALRRLAVLDLLQNEL